MFDLDEFARIAPKWARKMRYHSELGSTNDEALRLCSEARPEGAVVLADHQVSGKGRRGASWASQPGGGLLFSVVIRPSYDKKFWSRLALATGLGVATVLREQWGVKADVKWPNDILIGEKKCGGILVETQGDFAVVGVGINVNYAPKGDDAVALNDVSDPSIAAEPLLRSLLNQISDEVAVCANRFDQQLARLRRICCLTGKKISFNADNEAQTGLVKGIGNDGELLVEQNGVQVAFHQADTIRLI